MTNIKLYEKWMKLAYREAEKAFEVDEIPVGAVVVKNSPDHEIRYPEPRSRTSSLEILGRAPWASSRTSQGDGTVPRNGR